MPIAAPAPAAAITLLRLRPFLSEPFVFVLPPPLRVSAMHLSSALQSLAPPSTRVKRRCGETQEQAHASARLFRGSWTKGVFKMIGKFMSALIGAEVERRRQQSGLKGAVLGAAA